MKKALLVLTLFGTLLFTGCSKKSEEKDHTENDGLFKYEYVYTTDSRTITCSAKKDKNSEYELYYKYYTKYDEDKYIIEDIEYSYSNETNDWVGERKEVNDYSTDHKKNTRSYYGSSETDDSWAWSYEGKTYFEYMIIKGKNLESLEIIYDSDGVKENQYEYSYSSNGFLKNIFEYEFDTEENDFIYLGRTNIIENSDTQETQIYYKADEDEAEKESSKTVYTFDKDGNELEENYYLFNSGTWTLDYKSVTEVKNGKIISKTYYDYESGAEFIYYKTEYEYLTDDYIIYTSHDTDEENGRTFHNREKYLEDKFGNEIFKTYYSWDEETETWIID